MTYRKINYSPEALARRKEYQRQYASERRKTPEGKEKSRAAWSRLRGRLTTEEHLEQSRERQLDYRARKMGVCADLARQMLLDGCQICGKRQLTGRKRRSLVLDHNHKTGKFRGVLCSGCNTAIGQFNDNPKLLERALRYLLGDA